MVQTLQIGLPESVIEFAQSLRDRGGFSSVQEVIAASLLQLQSEMDAEEDDELEELRTAVRKGQESIARGERTDAIAFIDELIDSVERPSERVP